MTNEVRVPFGDSPSDTATLLLAAVEELDQDVHVVKVDSLGGFLVPEEVAKKAGLDSEHPGVADGSYYSEEQVEEAAATEVAQPTDDSAGPSTETPPPAKKAAAKKTAAKKSTAKKGK